MVKEKSPKPRGGKPVFAVIGAGNGGQAMAGHLGLMGFKVSLYNRSEDKIALIRRRGTISLEGEIRGVGRIRRATTDLAEAVRGADIVMVVTPATAHAEIARNLAPCLEDGQVVVLNPGRTGGALEFRSVLRESSCPARVLLAEAQTLLYAARAENMGQVRIFGVKHSVPLGVLPAHCAPEACRRLGAAFPQFVPVANVLETSFNNIGAVFHPVITLFNAARIQDTHGGFQFYVEGITRSLARILESVDRERVAVAGALGAGTYTARQWLYLAYNAVGHDLYGAIMANEGYYGIKAPPILANRYLTEDVPMSLVPIASVGEQVGVSCPTIRAIIHCASVLLDRDFSAGGRTAARLGLAGLSLKEIRYLVLEG